MGLKSSGHHGLEVTLWVALEALVTVCRSSATRRVRVAEIAVLLQHFRMSASSPGETWILQPLQIGAQLGLPSAVSGSALRQRLSESNPEGGVRPVKSPIRLAS